jgi:hypothetical protein
MWAQLRPGVRRLILAGQGLWMVDARILRSVIELLRTDTLVAMDPHKGPTTQSKPIWERSKGTIPRSLKVFCHAFHRLRHTVLLGK